MVTSDKVHSCGDCPCVREDPVEISYNTKYWLVCRLLKSCVGMKESYNPIPKNCPFGFKVVQHD